MRSLFLDMNGIALRAQPPGPVVRPAPAWPRLGRIAVPTLVVWGDLDFPHVQANARHLVAAIPGARGQVIAGVAHLPSLERPTELGRLMLDFLHGLE